MTRCGCFLVVYFLNFLRTVVFRRWRWRNWKWRYASVSQGEFAYMFRWSAIFQVTFVLLGVVYFLSISPIPRYVAFFSFLKWREMFFERDLKLNFFPRSCFAILRMMANDLNGDYFRRISIFFFDLKQIKISAKIGCVEKKIIVQSVFLSGEFCRNCGVFRCSSIYSSNGIPTN